MAQLSKKSLGLNELIHRIKQDLLIEQLADEPALFAIDEVILEVNFVVCGDIDSGFDIGVVTLGSQVSEERTQKVTIKMTPLVSKQQMIEVLNSRSQKAEETVDISAEVLLRGV